MTVRSQKNEVERVLHEIDSARRIKVLEEPAGKNTAAAIGLAAVRILGEEPAGIMAVFPADHYIGQPSRFLELLGFGASAAGGEWLVTLGIRPTLPETGYGYVQKGDRIGTGGSPGNFGGAEMFKAVRFAEKPDVKTARAYLESGDYFWNGGIFIWRADLFMSEMKTFLPDHYEKLRDIGKAPEKTDALYAAMPSISVDYGILERSGRVAVIPADIGWSDVGSWSALHDLLPKDQNGNAVTGEVIQVDTSGSLVRAEERLVATIGIDDLIVVETADAVLVCRKDRSQDVRTVAQKLLDGRRAEAIVPQQVLKPWGAYKVLDQGSGYQVKWLDIRPGERLSLQSHEHRSEHWTVAQGEATVTLDDRTIRIPAGEDILIPRRARHRVSNQGSAMLRIIEVQTGNYLEEDDIVRYQDDYGRTG